MARTRLAAAVAAILPVAGIVLGCLWSSASRSATPADIKRAMKQSLMYESGKLYYSEGIPDQPDLIQRRLSPRAIGTIDRQQGQLLFKVHEVQRDAKDLISKLAAEGEFGPIGRPLRLKRLSIEQLGRPTAVTTEDGEVRIDIRVLQAIFRGAIIEHERDMDPASRSFSEMAASAAVPEGWNADEYRAIAGFVGLLNAIDSAKAPGTLGMIASIIREDADFSELVEMFDAGSHLEGYYVGAGTFLIAHEYAHLALGHHALIRDFLGSRKPATLPAGDRQKYCELRRKLEESADRYGVAITSLLSRSNPAGVISGVGTGYWPFFKHAYPLSGFGSFDDAETCEYPAPAQRLQRAEEFGDDVDGRVADFVETRALEVLEREYAARIKQQGTNCVLADREWKRVRIESGEAARLFKKITAKHEFPPDDPGLKGTWFRSRENDDLAFCRQLLDADGSCSREYWRFRAQAAEGDDLLYSWEVCP